VRGTVTYHPWQRNATLGTGGLVRPGAVDPCVVRNDAPAGTER
jgi:hypothetical protein